MYLFIFSSQSTVCKESIPYFTSVFGDKEMIIFCSGHKNMWQGGGKAKIVAHIYCPALLAYTKKVFKKQTDKNTFKQHMYLVYLF